MLRQLSYNCIARPGLFSRKHSERQGSRTESVQPSLLGGSRDALYATHSFIITSLMSSVCLSLLQCLLSCHTPYTHSHTERQHTTNNTHVNKHAHTPSHEYAQTHEHKQTQTQLATTKQSCGSDKITVEYRCTCPSTHFLRGCKF